MIASSITRTGQEYALTAQLIDPQTGDTVRAYTERSYGEDHILEALDVLSRDVREALGESLYQIHRTDKPLPQVTTKSLSALQQYADGAQLWRLGKFQDATTLFKAAIASDPEFAMATRRSAARTTAISTMLPRKAKPNMRKPSPQFRAAPPANA